MKIKPFWGISLFFLFLNLACANSTPTPAAIEPTAVSAPTLVPTEPPTPTPLPPTATATEIPASPTPATPFDFRVYQEGILAFDPVTPDTLYFSTKEATYKSGDGGNTWALVSSENVIQVPAVVPYRNPPSQSEPDIFLWAVDPLDPTNMYGYTYRNSPAQITLMKSTDADQTWSEINQPDHYLIAGDGFFLTIDPQNSTTLYLAAWSTLYKSINGGDTWQEINRGLPAPGPGFDLSALVFDPKTSSTLYLVDRAHGLFKSTDTGENWNAIIHSTEDNSPFMAKWLMIDSLDSNILYAQNNIDGQLYTSPDGGQTWQPTTLGLPSSNIYAFIISLLNPSTRYAILSTGEISGLFKSTDNGQTWSEIPTALLP